MTGRHVCIMVTSSVTATTFLGGYLAFLREDGWEVTLVCSEGPGVVDLARAAGARYEALRMEREPSPLRDFGAVLRAVRLLRRIRPDVLVYATPKAALIGSLAGWVARVPRRVYELWGLRLETSSGVARRVFTLLERVTMRLSTQVIANSRSLAVRAADLGLPGSKEVVVLGAGSSHGVDADRFSLDASIPPLEPALRRSLGRTSAPVIGFIGRLHPDKGIDTLFQALRICADRGAEAQLLIVGGDEGARVDERIDGHRTTISVHVTGFAPDVRPMLRAMDVLVLPSRREGFPNVVLEAAAMTVPAIVSDATGCVDSVIDGTTGVIVPVGDADRLAAELMALLENRTERERLGSAARARAVADFDPRKVWALHAQRWVG